MLKNQGNLLLAEQNNVFLIDWLTVVIHGASVSLVQALLGMDSPDIPWETDHVFRNGYPMQTSYKHICIWWGADDARYYRSDEKKSASEKVRYDMGICVNMSGQGCREFEAFAGKDWMKFFLSIQERYTNWSVTRLDLAYDDHIGILDIYRIANDVEDRYYTSPSRTAYVHWSDDLNKDIQGLSVEIGSRQSPVLLRIYDKAAERGFDHDKHWIRVELQLRNERALVAFMEIIKNRHIGRTASGILKNYCQFRVPSGTDDNKSRWPIADYWDKLILDMERISLWISPGEPYNFSKTQRHMIRQYGQCIITFCEISGSPYDLLECCRREYPVLGKKYQNEVDDQKRLKEEARQFAQSEAARKSEPFRELDETDLGYWYAADLFGGSYDEEID